MSSPSPTEEAGVAVNLHGQLTRRRHDQGSRGGDALAATVPARAGSLAKMASETPPSYRPGLGLARHVPPAKGDGQRLFWMGVQVANPAA